MIELSKILGRPLTQEELNPPPSPPWLTAYRVLSMHKSALKARIDDYIAQNETHYFGLPAAQYIEMLREGIEEIDKARAWVRTTFEKTQPRS